MSRESGQALGGSAKRRVFVVDDSATARYALCAAIESPGSGLKVVGSAERSRDALLRIPLLKPDVVIADVHLGREDGVELAAQIMETWATPILVTTGTNARDPALAFRSMKAGALEVCAKLPGSNHPAYREERDRLVRLIHTLSEVKVVTRRARSAPAAPEIAPVPAALQPPRVWLIGASTGGPPVIEAVLSALPRPFPLPIAIVQHISEGFASGFAEWLTQATGHRVVVCNQRQTLTPGTVYVASDARHMRVCGGQGVEPFDAPARDYQRPSVDILFESAALHLGSSAGAVVLTGMGKDGASGTAALRRRGALVVAQHPSTCVVDGMPRAARDLGGAQLVLPPREIAALLASTARTPV